MMIFFGDPSMLGNTIIHIFHAIFYQKRPSIWSITGGTPMTSLDTSTKLSIESWWGPTTRYAIQIAWTSRPSESALIQLFWENDAGTARSLLPSTFLSRMYKNREEPRTNLSCVQMESRQVHENHMSQQFGASMGQARHICASKKQRIVMNSE